MSLSISSLSFEHHTEALGIPEPSPRLSWSFSGNVQDWVQETYEVEILSESSVPAELYVLHSAQSRLVPWPSRPLRSGESATVRIRSSGKKVTTPWSTPHTVEVGLLDSKDWVCELVESPRDVDPTRAETPVLFRRAFQVTKPVRKARLYITAHGVYEPEINGIRVGDHVLAPGWTVYGEELSYQTFDVTGQLRIDNGGQNVLGVSVAEGWYAGRLGFNGGRHNIYGNRIGVIAQLVISYADGQSEIIVTNSNWKSGESPIVSASIYDGETYDMSKFHKTWSSPEFDDSSWDNVKTKIHDPKILRAPDASPIRQLEALSVVDVLKSPSGKSILDFGQNLVGWVRLKIPAASKGHKIKLVHTEVLENGECATRPLRVAKATDELILSGTEEHGYWSPRFTFHGFRYVEITNWPGPLHAADFSAVVIHTEMRKTAIFECSDPLLNRLHQNAIWSMKGNFVGIPTDCPQRDERLGWTGDLQAFATTATFLYDCHGMLKSWLRGVAAEQKATERGVPPLVSPNVITRPPAPMAIWGDCVILAPWDLYQSSGDKDFLEAQFESMEDWLEKGIPRIESGLWAETNLDQLGDWLDPAAPADQPGKGSTDAMLVANAFLIKSTDVMANTCKVLGYQEKEQKYLQQATSLRAAFALEYITANGRVLSDSQTAIALAIQFSLFPTEVQQAHAVARLDMIIRKMARFKIATGFAGTPILGHALTKVGKSQLFYRMLMNKRNPSWLYPVTMGATTIWERWDSMLPNGQVNPGEMTSFNHYALGSVADWMHTVIGGIRSLQAGWSKFLIEPIPGGKITHATTTFKSPYGAVKSAWEIVDGHFKISIEIPPNTTAEVLLPGQEKRTSVGSGLHEFKVAYTEPERPALPPPHPYAPQDDDEDSLEP